MQSRTLLAFLALAFGAAGSLAALTPVTFLEPRTFGTGWGQSLALADFNGDGVMDAVTVGTDVTVYLGTGHGSFTAQPPIGVNGTGIVAADFNGDGTADLAIASATGLIVLPGNGDGTFRVPLFYAGVFTVLTVGDFNGDGILDIAAGNQSSQVQIFFGSSGGNVQPGPLTTLPIGNPLAIVSADFNGDGKMDLAVTGDSGSVKGVAVLFGNGDGTFASPVVYATADGKNLPALVTADFNGDGAPDLAYAESDTSSSVNILLNKGQGTFSAGTAVAIQADLHCLVAADVNGDGVPDLVAGGSDLAVILAGQGDGSFQVLGQYVLALEANAIAIADFNADGVPDVVSANGDAYSALPPLALMLGTGKGKFQSSHAYGVGPDPNGTAVADFNQDGNLDLVVADDRAVSPVISVFPGNGKGSFGHPVSYAADEPNAVAVGDVNGDGKLDVVFTGNNCVGTLAGNGNGTFEAPIYSPCFGCEFALVVADFNRDGKLDVLVYSYSGATPTSSLMMLLGNGDGTFQPQKTVGPLSATDVFAVADFNNDGILDMVANNNEGTYLLLGNGDGTFGVPVLLNSVQQIAAIGDFNGDGNMDIALSHGAIYLGNGKGGFTPAFTIQWPGTGALVGDFNGDGIPDLIGGGLVQLGKGNGNFVAQQQQVVLPSSGFGFLAGDFNNDGKLDIAAFSAGSPVWILLNTTKP